MARPHSKHHFPSTYCPLLQCIRYSLLGNSSWRAIAPIPPHNNCKFLLRYNHSTLQNRCNDSVRLQPHSCWSLQKGTDCSIKTHRRFPNPLP